MIPLQQQQQQQEQQQSNLGGAVSRSAVAAAKASTTMLSPEDQVDGAGAAHQVSVISFNVGDKQSCHEITERHVQVIGSSGTHDHGSSKVKLKNIVDYKWEVKYYPGHLIAVHIDGKHVAYVINVNNKVSRMEGMIRVVNAQTGLRALIKGMCGEVLDLQFAHIAKERVLGSIDVSSLYVHKIDMLEGTLVCNLIIKVDDPLANYTPKYDKISWCPFVEAPSEDEDFSKLIVWARGSLFQCFNVNAIVAEHGIRSITPDEISTGYLKFRDEALTISWVTISPDGSTLGVGSTDGLIRFYQVYMHEPEPRCLHQWKPHNGKPVSSFFFLDNLTKEGADTYWKYAITGAANNTEFKVWDCGTWECLQTLNMAPSADKKSAAPMRFIAEIDRTSSYLVLTSSETRCCYVLQLVHSSLSKNGDSQVKDSESEAENTDANSSGVSNASSGSASTKRLSNKMPLAYIKSISEFPLSSGVLSFSIVDAAVRRYKCANDNFLCEELDDYDEETNCIYCVVVRMFIVQSKSMQECRILYQPTVTEETDVKSSLSVDSIGVNLSTSSEATTTTTPHILTSNGAKHVAAIAGRGLAHTKTNNKDNNHLQAANDEDDDDDDEGGIKAIKEVPSKIKSATEVVVEKTALEALLAEVKNAAQLTVQTTTTTSTAAMVSLGGAAVGDNQPAGNCEAVESDKRTSPHGAGVGVAGRGFTQVNLMTPDAFSATSNDKNTPDCVSSEVLNTILMLASVAGQAASPASKTDGMNLLNLVNNKIIEDQEHKKMQHKKFITIDNPPSTRALAEHLASGGSSPSREVQEIMSLQDYDKAGSSYSGDELLAEEQMEKSGEPGVVALSVADLESVAKSQSSSTSATNWPKAPSNMAVATTGSGTTTTSKHSAELQNAANLISQAVQATASSLSGSRGPPNLGSLTQTAAPRAPSVGGNNATSTATGSELAEINMKMSQLIDLVQMQSLQINSLQTEIVDLKKNNPMATPKNMTDFSFKLELQLSKMLEQYLKRCENEHKKKLAAFIAGREVQNRELCDSFVTILNQYMITHFGEIVAKVLNMELQRNLVPLFTTKIDHLQQQIQLDVAQKLTAFDLMLKENIVQVCKSKNIIDAFGKSVLVGVQGSLQAAFIDSMSGTLIPAYEKSSQHMFKQLHDAFSVGIKEFMEQISTYLQHLQPMQASSEEILMKFGGFKQHLEMLLAKHRSNVSDTLLETRKDVKSMEILLARQVQETIRVELRKYCENQAVAMRSQANTPAPPMYDMKDKIKLQLHQGQINKAFHQALLANDLSLVEFTLKHADQNAVFTPTCCLEQKVLLSLIQQISADMSNHNEVKQNYLAEALLAINLLDPITREHAPKVLQDLYRNCQMFIINYPKSSQCSNVRMLMKAVQAYNDKF